MLNYRTRAARQAALAALFGASLAAAGTVSACAQTPPATTPPAAATTTTAPVTAIDAAAKALLAQMSAAYQSVSTFSTTLDTTFQQGTSPAQSVHADVAFAKPNKVSAVVTSGTNKSTVISDGTHLFAIEGAATTTYQKASVGKDATSIADAIGNSHASATGILPLLVARPNADVTFANGATAITKLPDETLDGVAVDVVKIVTAAQGNGSGITVSFATGKEDHLLRRAVLAVGAQGTVTELYTNVKANPALPATAFTFTPPAGMKEVAPPPEPATFDPRLKVGTAPLPFAGTDLSGAKQTLAAYKGKVVLLDFWATWCPPCREEVPNIVANYAKYHAKGFDVVGVSLDQAGDKAKLVSYTKEHKMPWPQIYDGKYWQSALAKAYGVQAIPFSVLIGKDGKIVAVNPRGEDLEPALKAALAK